jgi:hypothetical protein
VLLLLPSQVMAEQDWTPSKVRQGHLQNIANQGMMMAMELVACLVPEDPAFPTPAEGYVVTFVAFYKSGFGMPSYWFLHSLLWYSGLELHNMNPSRGLHVATFMTLCEAYLEIDPRVQSVELFLPCLASTGPIHGINSLQWCGYSCQVRAWS